MVLRSPVKEIGIRRSARLRIVRVYGFRLDHALWLAVGQRSQHHRVHNTENRGVGPNAQCKRDNGHAGEARAIAQLPERVPNILD
jgi:hypothetical protein